jgi:hypothetical protein
MKHVSILGAGASREVGGPLMSDFLDVAEMLRRAGKFDAPTKAASDLVFRGVYELQRVQSKAVLDIDNLESVMVAFEMAALFGRLGEGELKPEDVGKLPDALTRLVAHTVEESVCFDHRDNSIQSQGPYRKLAGIIMALRKAREDVGILTFNYDLGADVALLDSGEIPDYRLNEVDGRGPTPLLKLHRSLSWTKDEKDECILPLQLDRRSAHPPGGPPGGIPFRVLDKLSHLGARSGLPVIVPPTWTKGAYFKAIQPVWRAAAEELQSADNIYVFGFSLPPSDSFFKLLYGLGTVGRTRLKRFWVFDPNSQVKERFLSMLGQGAQARFDFWPSRFLGGLEILQTQLHNEGLAR